ncbi:hypothetical protein [Methanomethylovorans sp.]|uniref:hypothetical protein n=1 Tax=Methanomethylovorans sp. TaxID=2758717 RepID=UPI00345E361B
MVITIEEADKAKKSEALKQKEEEAAVKAQERAIAEAEAAIAEAKKAKLKAEQPEGITAIPSGGTITTDDKFGYLAELVANDTLIRQVKKLVNKLSTAELPDNSKILLVDELNIAARDVQLLQVKSKLDILEKGLSTQIAVNDMYIRPGEIKKDAKKEEDIELTKVMASISSLIAIPAVASIIGSAAAIPPLLKAAESVVVPVTNVVSMFRKDYAIKGKAISLSDMALKALIAGELREIKEKKYLVYLPDFYSITESKLIETFGSVGEKRWELEYQAQLLQRQIVEPAKKAIAGLEAEIKKIKDSSLLECKKKELKDLTIFQQAAEKAVLQSESLMEAYDRISEVLLTAADGQNASPMATAISQEKILELQITHLLYAKIVSSGGEAITGKKMIGSGETAYLGGSVVSYILAKVEGDIVAAGTLVEVGGLNYKLGSKEISAFGNK